MNITVLFDEDTDTFNLLTGFGLSLLIGNSVIFDTGSDGNSLLYNLNSLNILTDRISTIVLSHEHWDHIDGIFTLLSVIKNPNVYICPGFSRELKKELKKAGAKIHTPGTLTKITRNIYTTGEIKGTYNGTSMPEQSLIITRTPDHATLICGCSHYNLETSFKEIQNRIATHLNHSVTLDSVIGGLHLRNKTDETIQQFGHNLRDFGITQIAPLHCSGDAGKEFLNTLFPSGYHGLKVGSTLAL